MEVTKDWKRCFKIKPAFVRLVRGEKEEIKHKHGLSWVYPKLDLVMCGEDEFGAPNESDLYPIERELFENSYMIDEERPEVTSKLLCRHSGKPAQFLIDISRRFRTSDVDVLRRIEEYDLNPQRHQTMLTVIGDERDEMGLWIIREVTCTSCEESMSPNAASSHLMTEDEYRVYAATVKENC